MSTTSVLSSAWERFRWIGILEGISYLLLLGVAMPIKYIAHIPEPVKYVGWAHGVLFMLYIVTLLNAALVYRWSFLKVLLGFVASLLPFGPFIFEKKIEKKHVKKYKMVTPDPPNTIPRRK